ncbi:MAG: hypothetical protein PVI67_16595, partial [Anaerolineae bacterium]
MFSVAPSRRFGWISLWLAILCLTVVVQIAPLRANAVGATGPAEAWEKARRAGSYEFSADIVQTVTVPPTVLNVGRESSQQRFHLEGATDLLARRLDMSLWSQGGTLLESGTGTEVRVEGDRAYARGGGQDWQEIPNFAGALAPNGDFMAFLAGTRDVVEEGTETRAGVSFTRYTFQIDGPRYAAYVREQLQASLAREGGLPPGISVELPAEYQGLSGEGELWVGGDGLPLRQILHLVFAPDEDGQQTAADVTVVFSGFGGEEASAGTQEVAFGGQSVQSPSAKPRHQHVMAISAAILALALLSAKLMARRRSKKLYAILSLLVIASMIVVPLLQSERVHAFSEGQSAQAEAQEALWLKSEAQQEAARASLTSDWNPNANPLVAWTGARSIIAENANVYGPFLPDSTTAGDDGDEGSDGSDCDLDDPADDDGDGLPNGAECALGTDPDSKDTDSDEVGDNTEVTGFYYAGKTWYGDPLEMDTNKDGLGDVREWNLDQDDDGLPDDTDGDGTPDMFDRDNDGDGVPDDIDLSPYYKGTAVYTDDAPFELVLDELEQGLPVFAEFQLRPTDGDHLWYAFNVLDWPDGDRQGQIQDADGKTFYDVDSSLQASPNDNGDVKLIPMLEILITGERDNLPPTEECEEDGETYTCYPDLEAYGITVQERNDAGDKAAYVPLRLVTDKVGGEQVAFQGKMVYEAAASWGNAQQVRLVWAVQALVDVCKEYQDGQCAKYDTYNELQVLHSYYDDQWTLTGLNVREDHGTDVATVYEDPDVDNKLDKEEPLVQLMYGLNYTFLAGSDCDVWDDNGTPDDYDDDRCVEGNNERDLTVRSIRDRWNWTTNDAVPLSPDRWSIEQDILAVQLDSYATQDKALANLVMTSTREILDNHFTAHWTAADPISPTILFARENSFRSLGLDAQLDDIGGLVTWSEGERRLTLDLVPNDVELMVVAGLSWAPYRYDDEDE